MSLNAAGSGNLTDICHCGHYCKSHDYLGCIRCNCNTPHPTAAPKEDA